MFAVTVSTVLRWLYTVNYNNAAKFLVVSALSGFFSLASLSVAAILVRGLPEHHAYVTLIVILLFNCIMIHYPSSRGESRFGLPLLYVLGAITFTLFVVFPSVGITFIPKRVMSLYKFGNFKASLVIDQKGCKIAHTPEIGEGLELIQESGQCRLADMIIYSRLGNMYYVRKDGASVCFTIPATEVLSWSVRNDQPR